MPSSADLVMLAGYNAWMNERLYDAAATLPQDEIARDRGAFFGSLLGTLNHMVVADIIWLKRFAAALPECMPLHPVRGLPDPAGLAATVSDRLDTLREHRRLLDAVLADWMPTLDEAALGMPIAYRNVNGEPGRRRLGSLLVHVFNHQTHHRGQATTLLSQAGIDIGVTDLLARIPNET